MDDRVEEILSRNGLDSSEIDSEDLGPEESRRNHRIKADNQIYYLSFPVEREAPCRSKSVKQKILSENFIYKTIRKETGLRAPEVVDTDLETYILVKEIEGRSSIELFKDAEDSRKEEIARIHGKALAEIHGISQKEIGYFGESGLRKSYESWKEFMSESVDRISGNTATGLEKTALNYLNENLGFMDVDMDPVVVYGDLQPWNTVYTEDNGLGVIDGESCFSGHKEYDLAQAAVAWSDKFNVSERFLKSYMRSGHLKQGWEERHDYYRVYLYLSALIDARYIGWTELEEEFHYRLGRFMKTL